MGCREFARGLVLIAVIWALGWAAAVYLLVPKLVRLVGAKSAVVQLAPWLVPTLLALAFFSRLFPWPSEEGAGHAHSPVPNMPDEE